MNRALCIIVGACSIGCVELFAELPPVDAFVDTSPDLDPGTLPDAMSDATPDAIADAAPDAMTGPSTTRCDGQRDDPPCNGAPPGTEIPDGWVYIPPGTYLMGSADEEIPTDRRGVEGPRQQVRIGGHFLMMRTELTQGEWRALAEASGDVGLSPAFFDGDPDAPCDADTPDLCPVERINFIEALWAANAMSARDGLPQCYDPVTIAAESLCAPQPGPICCNHDIGQGCDTLAGSGDGAPANGWYCNPGNCPIDTLARWRSRAPCSGVRLPTSAEWEYAARAGSEDTWWSGNTEGDLAAVDWYGGNANGRTHPVGQPPTDRGHAHPWGLYDVHGNVSEHVIDMYGPYPAPPPDAPLTDPYSLLDNPQTRQARGGGFANTAAECRLATRSPGGLSVRSRSTGVRLVRDLPPLSTPGPTLDELEILADGRLFPGDRALLSATAQGTGPFTGAVYAIPPARRQTVEVARFETVGERLEAEVPWDAVNAAVYVDPGRDGLAAGRSFGAEGVDVRFVVRIADATGRAAQQVVTLQFGCGIAEAPRPACDGVCLDTPDAACP